MDGKCEPSPCGADPPEKSIGFEGTTVLSPEGQVQLNKWYGKQKQKWLLCYKGSKDGFSAGQFHGKCDAYGTTVSVFRTTTATVFGGYVDASWAGNPAYKGSSSAWLFQLDKAAKMPASCNQQYAMYTANTYGPTFGGGHDLTIDSTMKKGTSNLGHSYQCPASPQPCSFGNDACKSYLAGSSNAWTLDEVEVFYPVP